MEISLTMVKYNENGQRKQQKRYFKGTGGRETPLQIMDCNYTTDDDETLVCWLAGSYHTNSCISLVSVVRRYG